MSRPAGVATVARRLVAAVPVLFGVTLLTFFTVGLLPGDAARQLLGPEATETQVAQLRTELGLDRPIPARYAAWLRRAAAGDLGRSLASGQRVSRLLGACLPVTLELVGYALALSLGFAVAAGLLAARYPSSIVDGAASAFAMASLSTPSYVAASVLVLLLAVRFPVLPSIGYVPLRDGLAGNLESLTLPAASLALPLCGVYTRFLRGDLLEQIDAEGYVSAARARGLSPWRVLLSHALRNSLLGLLTLVGLDVAALVGGTVVIEQIFSLPGLGRLLLTAIDTRDAVVVQAVVLVLAGVTVLANLGVDLLCAALDPRVRRGGL